MKNTFLALMLFCLVGKMMADDCSNPLGAALNFTLSTNPSSVSGLNYCKSLKTGQSCCTADIVNSFQQKADSMVAKLTAIVASRDVYMVQTRDQTIPQIQAALLSLQNKSMYALAMLKANIALQANTSQTNASNNTNSSNNGSNAANGSNNTNSSNNGSNTNSSNNGSSNASNNTNNSSNSSSNSSDVAQDNNTDGTPNNTDSTPNNTDSTPNNTDSTPNNTDSTNDTDSTPNNTDATNETGSNSGRLLAGDTNSSNSSQNGTNNTNSSQNATSNNNTNGTNATNATNGTNGTNTNATNSSSSSSSQNNTYTNAAAAVVIQSLITLTTQLTTAPPSAASFLLYQQARSSCIVQAIIVQAAAWCLGCSPSYASVISPSGSSGFTLPLGGDVCSRLQSACYDFVTESSVQSAVLTARTINATVTSLNAILDRVIANDSSALTDLANAIESSSNSSANVDTSSTPVTVPDGCTNSTNCTWICSTMFKNGQADLTLLTVGGSTGSGVAGGDATVSSRLLIEEESGVQNRVLQTGNWNPSQDEAGVTVTFPVDPAQVSKSSTAATGSKLMEVSIVCFIGLLINILL